MFKIKKIDDKTNLAIDEVTNDPVATINTIRSLYSNKATYHAIWHPVMHNLYPHSKSGFEYMDGVKSDSKDGILGSIESKYSALVNDKYKKEPLEKEHKGKLTEEAPDGYGGRTQITRDVYHLLHDGKHVATLKVKSNSENLSSNVVEFVGDQPTKDQEAILSKKYPTTTPINLMNRVAHFQTIKNKAPSFIGHKTYIDSKSHVFKTSLTPENASTQYEKHLTSNPENLNAVVTRLSPTMFTVKTKHAYGSTTHIVDSSEPGTLTHHVSKVGDYVPSSTNSTIID